MTNEEFIQSIALSGEEWRDVVGYEGLYSVSSYGRVVSIGRYRTYSNRNGHYVPSKLLHPSIGNSNGKLYYSLMLCRNGVYLRRHVHRLVALAFIPNPFNYTDVDHINRDGLDNRVSNLRWCTRAMNMLNENTRPIMSASQRKKKLPSLHKPVVRLDNNTLLEKYDSITEAAKFGYTVCGIVDTCKGKQKSHRGFQWMYLSDYESQVSMSKNSTQSSTSPTP